MNNFEFRSDVDAKDALSMHLSDNGYSKIEIVSSPSDIIAFKDNKKYYFEVKKTSRTDKYFGAATTTEWKAALENPETYFFVVCIKGNDDWKFNFYTPQEFLKYSTIPPFKVYFSVPLSKEEESKPINRKTAIQATKENLKVLIKFFESLKIK